MMGSEQSEAAEHPKQFSSVNSTHSSNCAQWNVVNHTVNSKCKTRFCGDGTIRQAVSLDGNIPRSLVITIVREAGNVTFTIAPIRA